MARGGKRKGAGRKVGSVKKPRIADYLTPEEIEEIVENAKQKAKDGDATVLKLLIEQIFGRAPQSIDLGNKNGEPLKITWQK
jgi:hypothetical protein